jgi:hypothetical protein
VTCWYHYMPQEMRVELQVHRVDLSELVEFDAWCKLAVLVTIDHILHVQICSFYTEVNYEGWQGLGPERLVLHNLVTFSKSSTIYVYPINSLFIKRHFDIYKARRSISVQVCLIWQFWFNICFWNLYEIFKNLNMLKVPLWTFLIQ